MTEGNSHVTKEIERWACPKCGKVIDSLYSKQLEHLKKQHNLIHNEVL
jgi:hypothetical protein